MAAILRPIYCSQILSPLIIIFLLFRGESILLFLVQTVGRQSIEQRQCRSSRPRSASASSRKTPSSDLGLLYDGFHLFYYSRK